MKTKGKKPNQLSDGEKQKLVRSHEDGSTVHELAKKYGIAPTSVAAYVANAHRR